MSNQNWQKVALGDLLDYEQPQKYIVEDTKYNDLYKIPVLTAGKSYILGYTNESKGIYDNLPTILFDDFTTDSRFIDFKFKVKSSAVKMLTAKDKLVNLKYVFLMIQGLKKNSVSHKRFYLSVYQNKKIIFPFRDGKPDLEKQNEVVSILEKTNNLNKKSTKAQNLLDEHIRSVFYEMFLKTKDKFDIKTFKDISILSQGLQIPISERKKKQSKNSLPYITIQFLNGRKSEEFIENPRSSVICRKEDVLMTRTGNTGQVVSGVEGVFHNNFFKIDYNRDVINRVYLIFYLRQPSVRRLILSRAGQSTIPDLNHKDFYSIPIPVPPISFQKRFASIVEKVEILKEKQRQESKNAEELFNSLMQKAFNGELK